jgi:hypothetical protein
MWVNHDMFGCPSLSPFIILISFLVHKCHISSWSKTSPCYTWRDIMVGGYCHKCKCWSSLNMDFQLLLLLFKLFFNSPMWFSFFISHSLGDLFFSCLLLLIVISCLILNFHNIVIRDFIFLNKVLLNPNYWKIITNYEDVLILFIHRFFLN